MSGRHEGPPVGSAAREATAPPYHGTHRADEDENWRAFWFCCDCHRTYFGAVPDDERCEECRAAQDDPPRCWSCAHPFDAGCECLCCYDSHDGNPDEV